MDYKEHKQFYEAAYKTGSDLWSHFSTHSQGLKLMEKLKPDSLILDLGSGRGLLAKRMAEDGFRVIGLDFENVIVNKANAEVRGWGLAGKVKFMTGNALDIPFTDASFDGACDFGLMENLYKEDWQKYAKEVARVLKPGGFYLNVSLSRNTEKFFGFSPINSPDGELEKYGMHYHFFDQYEMEDIFSTDFKVVSQEVEFLKKPNEVSFLETLFVKK